MNNELLYETHLHTPLCKHAVGQPEDYAQAALNKGLDGIIVTCHIPLPNGMAPRTRMCPEEYPDYIELVYQSRESMKDVIDIRLGLEIDFIPGLEAWTENLLNREPLDYVLGSVHLTEEYKRCYNTEDWHFLHRQYFRSLADAAETGYFICLSHPDLIKNYGMDLYNLEDLMEDVRTSLDRIAATGIAMELNTSGKYKRGREMNPCPEILREMSLRGIPVILGADAHSPDRVAGDFLEAINLLEQAGYGELHVCLKKNRTSVSLEAARRKLQQPASV